MFWCFWLHLGVKDTEQVTIEHRPHKPAVFTVFLVLLLSLNSEFNTKKESRSLLQCKLKYMYGKINPSK